jgi:hypothetical protein
MGALPRRNSEGREAMDEAPISNRDAVCSLVEADRLSPSIGRGIDPDLRADRRAARAGTGFFFGIRVRFS